MFRVGQGYDSHRIKSGNSLRVGGLDLVCDYAFVAHSDGDVLIHAIIDAMLGACNLGDIGSNFPDTDPKYKDIDSLKLLKATDEKIKSLNYEIINIDSTVILEKPKLRPHISAMKGRLAKVLGIDDSRISIKAKTAEGIGSAGRVEVAHAQAVVLLMNRSV